MSMPEPNTDPQRTLPSLASINPATGVRSADIAAFDDAQIAAACARAADAAADWASTPVPARAMLLTRIAEGLRARRGVLAGLMTEEMGKLIGEALAEVDKCAWVCDYYAAEAAGLLADEVVASDARRSLIACQPLGTVLAVMPWNFPFWQVFRCAAPALAAGNALLLKHASNVPRCALAIERVVREAGAPQGLFQSLLIGPDQVERVIADPAVRAVSLTGSEAAGRAVGALAGRYLKKTVLELGGSDAFVVLADADLEQAVRVGVQSRFLNAGQSCIAAKRFILVEAIADAFLSRFTDAVKALRPGDPLEPATTLAPLARADLRDTLHAQVQASVGRGAVLVTGGAPLERPGWYYAPTVLDQVAPSMPAWEEELFGPVAAVIRARDANDALRIANASRFGLGGSVWTGDLERGEAFARGLACGAAFVNGLVKSDPRLPFGGIGDSGYGRELAQAGIREFCNLKTLWVA